MEYWVYSAWLSWVTPIIGALIVALIGKHNEKLRDYLAITFSFLSLLFTLSLIPILFQEIEWPLIHKIEWINAPSAYLLSSLEVGVIVDPLSIIVSNVVSFISFLIMVFSLGYMKGEEGLTRYWFLMDFFIGNMLLLVFSSNLIQMMFGWEGVGLCSYALIGFWYKDRKEDWLKCWVGEPPEAYPPSHCGLKAFLVTRFGDLLMISGTLILIIIAKTVNFIELKETIPVISEDLRWLILPAFLLIFGGAVGKSAQLPLMEWLPDAMAGPTTVSALIHAATMVKAGVFLVARIFPIAIVWMYTYPQLSGFFTIVLWIGTLTAFIAGLQAVVSSELKKVLAYSTVSQLGYMMMALGAGGLTSSFIIGLAGGVFHLMSHALFKAALFLSAGSVLHTVGSRFLRDMGGLRKYMPKTFLEMLLAACSLMGVPILFSGFWSKDMVLEAVYESGSIIAYMMGVLTAAITAFYTVRMVILTFITRPSENVEKKIKEHKIHEAPSVMWIPVLVLVVVTVGLGLSGPLISSLLEEKLSLILEAVSETVHEASIEPMLITATLSLIALIIGGGLSYALYSGKMPALQNIGKSEFMNKLRYFLFRRLYLNAFYYKVIVNPTISLGNKIYSAFEINIIDKGHFKLSDKVKSLCNTFRKTHPGILNYNVMAIIIGLFIFLLLALGW